MKIVKKIIILLLALAVVGCVGVVPASADVYSVPIDSYDAFRATVLGNAYDTDGVYWQNGLDYSYQCWDGANLLWQQLGRTLQTGGQDAKGTWLVEWARYANAGTEFTLITNKYDIKRGDVVVFGPLSDGEWQISSPGHIGFADEDWNYSKTYQNILDQNFAGRKYFSVHSQNYGSFLGAFRFNRWNTSYGYLNVSGFLDDTETETIESFGTFDVYVNGDLIGDDVSDMYSAGWSPGANYVITDIRAADGHTYDGVYSGSLTGTINSPGVDVRLAFSSYGTLDIAGDLDGAAVDDLSGVAQFDVIINGEAVDASGAAGYNKKWPRGTQYTITNIQAADGYYFDGVSADELTGTIGLGTTEVALRFWTIKPVTGEWQESGVLPGYIDPALCEIEYQHTYTTTAQASPGEGWTQVDEGTVTYENVGGVYDSDFGLDASDTRLHVGTYYYHYCGASVGNRVNFAWTSQYTDYHVAGDINNFNAVGQWTDDDDARYQSYQIQWISGQWAGGDATCAAGRSAIWYRRYQYQDRVAVTNYIWSRTSDWEQVKDETAQSVRYRYRLKDTEQPVITALDVTEITTKSFTLMCSATDDSSIAKIVFSTWSEAGDEAQAVVQEIAPQLMDGVYQASAVISVADHGSLSDCWYYTKVQVFDSVGNEVLCEEGSVKVYVPVLVHLMRKVHLAEDLKVIEASAFEGDISIGEVILPDGLERIESRAFAECSRLMLVQVPGSVESIDDTAFAGSSNVVLLCPADSAAAAYARKNEIPYLTAE